MLVAVTDHPRVRRAESAADFDSAGALLDRFNREFDVKSPGAGFLARRVGELAGEAFATYLASDGAEDGGVAVVRFRPAIWSDGNEAYLAELYVVPEMRRRGLGAELMEAVLGFAREGGCDWIDLGTEENDTDARRLYERFGFSNFDIDAADPEEAGRMLVYERTL